ncbi:hypothetical protein N9955_00180 [bacterium]|nr:hypothetical protein [bacterium]
MKNTIVSTLIGALLTISVSAEDSIPLLPAGFLQATPQVVQTGTYPTLAWAIAFPRKVGDLAQIVPSSSIKLLEQAYVSVSPVGIKKGMTAEVGVSYKDSTYQEMFYGTNEVVDPATPLYIKKMNAGDTLSFGGRYVRDNEWTPFYTSKSANLQVMTYVKGDSFPKQLKSEYLRPYVDGSGKVRVGPLSALIVMELEGTQPEGGSFDYQDVILHVSFSKQHPNNGHGNNLDGVDSSNPSQGNGGPNGKEDPSAGVDDERK